MENAFPYVAFSCRVVEFEGTVNSYAIAVIVVEVAIIPRAGVVVVLPTAADVLPATQTYCSNNANAGNCTGLEPKNITASSELVDVQKCRMHAVEIFGKVLLANCTSVVCGGERECELCATVGCAS